MLSSPVSSFERVYREQFDFVWRTLRALGVRDDALDDALQDVFLVVHRRLPQFEGRASIKTWTYEIARRVASRYRSRSARDAARHLELPELRARDDLESTLDAALAAEVMREFLWGLDEDRRRAFVLSEFWEMPGREIAETLGANMNTIYARIRSARTELERVAKRLRARDARTLTSTLSERPPRGSRQRTMAGVLAALGSPAAPTLGLGGLAGVAAVISVGVVAATLASADPPQARPLEPRLVRAPPVRAVPPAPARPAPTSRPVPAPTVTEDRAPAPAQRKPRTTPRATPSLDEELDRIRSIRGAIRAGRFSSARQQISAYRETFDRGALHMEVEALDIELDCRAHAPMAPQRLRRFRRPGADAALIARLEAVCANELAPRKPERGGTQPR